MLAETLTFVLITILVYSWYLRVKVINTFTSKGLKVIPGIPVFGSFWRSTFQRNHIVEDIHDFYNSFPNERYVGILESNIPIILVRELEIIKQITVENFHHFVDRRQIFDEGVEPVLNNTLVMMKGDKWRHMRSTLSPAFTAAKMKQMVTFMNSVGQKIVEHLQRLERNEDQTTEEMNADNLVRHYAIDVIASAVFDLEINTVTDKSNKFYQISQSLVNFTISQKITMFLIKTFPNLAKSLNLHIFPEETTTFFKNILKHSIEYRRSTGLKRPDMIDLLMESKKDWNEDELAAQGLVFFLAGFEGPASVLALAIHELALHPGVQKKLFEEIRQFKDEKKNLNYETMHDLKYMHAVVCESLRKWTPGTFMERVCVKSFELPPPRPGGEPFRVEPGQVIINVVYSFHMDGKYYPDPHCFRPERFSEENVRNAKPFTFMPFGVGPRNCIGYRFALLEMKVFLYHIVLNFEIMRGEKTSAPLRLRPHHQMRVVGDTWVKFRRRN